MRSPGVGGIQPQVKPVRDVQDLLKGAAPGVTVRVGQGNVGTGGVIRMRGVTSLSLNNQPLIYVDGIRVNNDFRSGPSIRGGRQTSRINDINPEEIESIEIGTGGGHALRHGSVQWRDSDHHESDRQAGGELLRPHGRLPNNYAFGPSGELLEQDLYEEELAAGRNAIQNGHSQGYDLSVRGGTEGVPHRLHGTTPKGSSTTTGRRS